MAFTVVTDRTGRWLQRSFINQRDKGDSVVSHRRDIYRDALSKFTDTSLGGSFEINPIPQFCRYADPRPRSAYYGLKDRLDEGSSGLGWAYDRMFSDTTQRIYLRMGDPEFNSLTSFYGGFYNRELSLLARRSRSAGIAETAGKLVGSILAIPFLPLTLSHKFYRIASQIPSSRYYYSKPSMPKYWKYVETMVNTVAANMKLIAPIWEQSFWQTITDTEDPNDPLTDPQDTMTTLAKAFPNLFLHNGGINIYGFAGRATRMSIDEQIARRKILKENKDNPTALKQALDEHYKKLETTKIDDGHRVDADGKERTLDVALADYLGSVAGSVDGTETDSQEESTGRGLFDFPDGEGGIWGVIKGKWEGFQEQSIAEMADGTQFLCLRVNNTGSASESFSNSTKEADISSKLNSFSGGAKEVRTTLLGGNFGDDVISNVLETVFGAATKVAQGVAEGIGLGGLIGLMGSAYIDIPEVYDNSSSSMNSLTYNLELRATSAHPLAILKDIVIPMCCVLGVALPQSTGTESYTQPMLVELWDKSKAKSRLALCTDCTITRGVGSLGWSVDGYPLAVDISITFKELSRVTHMPAIPSVGLFSEASLFNDYMAVLGGLSLYDQESFVNRIAIATAKLSNSFYQAINPSRYASQFWDSGIGKTVRIFTTAVERP